jgi:hypothetical protein
MSLDMQADVAVGHLEGFIAALTEQSEREEFASGDIMLREPIGVCTLITPPACFAPRSRVVSDTVESTDSTGVPASWTGKSES